MHIDILFLKLVVFKVQTLSVSFLFVRWLNYNLNQDSMLEQWALKRRPLNIDADAL